MKILATLVIAAAAAVAATSADAQRPDGPRGPGPGPGFNRPGPGPGVVRPLPPPMVRPLPPRRPPIVFTPMPRIPVWTPSLPYASRYHDVCHRKAWRLRWFERRAGADGYFSPGERAELAALRRDVARTCGGWRWSY
jgi:hypothetical protein